MKENKPGILGGQSTRPQDLRFRSGRTHFAERVRTPGRTQHSPCKTKHALVESGPVQDARRQDPIKRILGHLVPNRRTFGRDLSELQLAFGFLFGGRTRLASGCRALLKSVGLVATADQAEGQTSEPETRGHLFDEIERVWRELVSLGTVHLYIKKSRLALSPMSTVIEAPPPQPVLTHCKVSKIR